jgi:uncharacterized protein (DUF2236 family)
VTKIEMPKSIDAVSAERFFSADTVFWQVHREMILLLAGGRALMMQLAHPKVAAGVADHSHFKEDPLGRLYRTMSTMWSIIFDETPKARAALDQVSNIHRKVRGIIQPAEPLPPGTRYDALEQELLLWVHATLIDSAMVAYDLFVHPLTTEEKLHYYEDTRRLAYLFEIPKAVVPASLADFNSYMEGMLKGNAVAVGPTALSLAEEILSPRPWLLRPATPLFRLVTAGLLPEKLRIAYGLDWNERREKLFVVLAKVIRRILPLAPKILRSVPNARAAEKNIFRRP